MRRRARRPWLSLTWAQDAAKDSPGMPLALEATGYSDVLKVLFAGLPSKAAGAAAAA